MSFNNWIFSDSEIFCLIIPSRYEAPQDTVTPPEPPADLLYSCQTYHQLSTMAPSFASITAVDLGGTGDCFFRCVHYITDCYNRRLESSIPQYSTSDTYDRLNVPLNTYIEDTHINSIAAMFGVTFRVVSLVNNSSYISEFGESGPVYYLFCEGLFHYYALMSEGILTENLYRLSLDEGSSDDEPVESQALDPYSYPVATSDLSVLYSFLVDSSDMIFPNPVLLLDVFRHTHQLVVRALHSAIHKDRKCPPPDFLKAYYKFRHNVFSGLCKFHLTPDPFPLDTDMPLDRYLPGSTKTPDWIIATEDCITIYEFTVGNTYGRVDFHKGGGSFAIKYSAECASIEQLIHKKCTVKLIAAVLNHYNMQEVLDTLGVESEDFLGILTDFFSFANTDKDILANAYSLSHVSVAKTIPLIPGLPTYPRQSDQSVIMVNPELLADLSGGYPKLLSSLENMGNRKVIVEYNLNLKGYRLTPSNHGLSAATCLSNLSNGLISVITSIKFVEDGKYKKLSDLYGTVPVTVPSSLGVRELPTWDYVPQTDYFYGKHAPTKLLTHGELAVLTQDDLIDLNKSSFVNFPPDYFERLCSMPLEGMLRYKGKKMLYNCTMDMDEIRNAIVIYQEKLTVTNQVSVFKSKPTFLAPIPTQKMDAVDLDALNQDMVSHYLKSGRGLYTKALLGKVKTRSFCKSEKLIVDEKIREMYSEYNRVNSNYHYKVRELVGTYKAYRDMDESQKSAIKPYLDKLRTAQVDYKKAMGTGKSYKGDRIVKLNCGPHSPFRPAFDNEMQHFSSKTPNAGVGLVENIEDFGAYLITLIDRLTSKSFNGYSFGKPYNGTTPSKPEILSQIKQNFVSRFDEFYEKHIDGTLLQQTSVFVERLAKFLFNESVKTYNSSYVKVDNLGFKNFLILSRGGPKIYKNQRSRLYKCFFCIEKEDLRWSGYESNANFEIFPNESGYMIVSPWSQMHQDVLFDYMSLSHRVFNQLYSVYTRHYTDFTNPIPKLSLMPFLLALHNRRKTEQLMHNSRYLIVNPLGFAANLTGIIEGFATKNHTYFDAYLKNCILVNYSSFGATLLKIRDSKGRSLDQLLDDNRLCDIWLGEPISRADMLTQFIYITYMMTKAPVTASIEQSSNLWEILQDIKEYNTNHTDVDGLNDKSLRMDVLKFDPTVYDDDFKYDPVFCQYLGHYLSGHINSRFSPGELQNVWDNIMDSDIDRMANSNGLRGYNSKNFFGKKGYEVVYSYLGEDINFESFENELEGYLAGTLSDASSKIQADKKTYRTEDHDFENLVFHIVHKIQRGGGREIFCMDLNTKRAQNPLERFFKAICKRIPNEFISIPSNKRHGIIHSDFYERASGKWVKKIVRWVLDCRRWAPHSVFQKYVHFVTGLSHVLPQDFLNHFNLFAEGMYRKSFITREHVISKMRNNERFKPYASDIKRFGKAADAFSMTVKFSFVMGIFNYLSTLLHSANQLVASEVIRSISLSRGTGLAILDPKCHSDDSVVSSYHESKDSVEMTVKVYDWMLKSANHMLSVKKSQVNYNVYLEFLSILYMFDRFLPVYPKFISSIPFKPTDQGFAADSAFAISQAIEMLSNGGTHEEAYLIMKTTSKFIGKVYNLPPIEGMPPQLFGEFDSHPVELLHAGANADVFRMFLNNPDKYWSLLNQLTRMELIKEDDPFLKLNWDMGSMLGKFKVKEIEWSENIIKRHPEIEWTVKNNKLGNGKLNLIWYYQKLRDRKFASSIVHEPEARLYSRIFGAGGYRRILKTDGSLNTVEQVFAVVEKLEVKLSPEIDTAIESLLNYMCEQLKEFYAALENTELVRVTSSNIKEKPVIFRTGMPHLGNLSLSSSEYVSYIKEPNAYKLLGRFTNPRVDSKKITESLELMGLDVEQLSADNLYVAVRKLLSQQEKTFRLISTMPGTERIIETNTAMLSYIEHCTYAHSHVTLKNKAAREIDWSRKLLGGKLPKIATDYMKSYWMCKTLSDFDILDLDIYTYPVLEQEKSLAEKLPFEWKMLLVSNMSSDTALADVSYWTYWEKLQIRLGQRWVGTGKCIIKIPEATLTVKVSSGAVSSIQIDTQHMGYFSTPSSWYLNNILKFSGINANFTDPSYVSPHTLHLGYSMKDKCFGWGRSRLFDLVVENVAEGKQLIPSEFYFPMRREKVRNHYIYHSNENQFYIDFFVPTEDPVSVSFKGLLDPHKLKAHSQDERILRFIQKLSIDVGGVISLDRTELIDKIGSSLLYNVIFDAPSRNKLIFGEEAEGYLIEALGSWKKTHPDFGYPDEEELMSIAKEENRPPFPRGVMKNLLKVGVSSVPEADFRNLILQLVHMHPEDQEKHLLSNYSYLDKNMRNDMLTVAMRSKLFYKSCYALGEHALPILMNILMLVGQVIENDNITCPTLNFMQRELKSGRNLKNSLRDIYWRSCMAVIVEGVYSDLLPQESKKFIRLYEILKELWNNKMGIYLNITPTKDAVARSIDFNTDWDTFSEMFKAVVVGHYNYNYKKEFKPGERFIVKDDSKFLCLKPYTRTIMSLVPKIQKNLVLTSYSRGRVVKKQVLSLEPGKPGVTGCQFYIPTEEGQEELTDGFYYDRDIHDDVEEDEDAVRQDLPEQAFVYTSSLDYVGVTSKRGCAWNVYFAGEAVSKDILAMVGEKVLYKKISYWNTLNDYVNPFCQYIFYLGTEGTKKLIEGYKRLTWEETMKELVVKDCYIPNIVHEGKTYSWEVAAKDPMLQSLFQGFDNYFKKIRSINSDEEVVRIHDILEVHLQFEKNLKLEEVRHELKRYLASKEKVEDVEDDQDGSYNTFEDIAAGIDMKSIFDRVAEGLSTESETGGLKEYFVEKSDFFTYEEPLLVLTDVQLRSEIEAIFPGYQDRLLNRDVRLSKKTKERIKDYARGKISQMQSHTAPRYKRLLLIIQAILQEVEECNFLQNESFDFAAMIDDLFSQALETVPFDPGNIADLLPDTNIVRLELDLSKIL
jgi:hypothetical protein